MVKGWVKGSFLVETAALFPVVFLVLLVSVYVTFYFHDKAVLAGVANETAAVGSERMRRFEKPEQEELEQYFKERLAGKMIFFGYADVHVALSEEKIVVEAQARRRRLGISVRGCMAVTAPEKYLGDMKKIKG